MSTTIAILGGVGLFLLGMSVMTSGLQALAGSGLRTTLSKAADEAIARVDAVRRLEALARHAWRSAAHLVANGAIAQRGIGTLVCHKLLSSTPQPHIGAEFTSFHRLANVILPSSLRTSR